MIVQTGAGRWRCAESNQLSFACKLCEGSHTDNYIPKATGEKNANAGIESGAEKPVEPWKNLLCSRCTIFKRGNYFSAFESASSPPLRNEHVYYRGNKMVIRSRLRTHIWYSETERKRVKEMEQREKSVVRKVSQV